MGGAYSTFGGRGEVYRGFGGESGGNEIAWKTEA